MVSEEKQDFSIAVVFENFSEKITNINTRTKNSGLLVKLSVEKN